MLAGMLDTFPAILTRLVSLAELFRLAVEKYELFGREAAFW